MTCKECRFFTTQQPRMSPLDLEDGVGFCRRNAPRGPVPIAWIEASKSSDTRGVILPFPIVSDDCWCGEFQLQVKMVG
jgi:hypothetical protein